MSVINKSIVFSAAMIFGALPAFGQSFNEGADAYNIGDYATALKNFRPLAFEGNADAQYGLGVLYDTGSGVLVDSSEASEWYLRAAEQGHLEAQSRLGVMYANGYGIPQNSPEAAKWYRRAGERGDAQAQTNLAGMYKDGEGVPQNNAEAAKWYLRAAEQGVAEAQFHAGGMLLLGRGVKENHTEAVRLIRLSAQQGHALALNQLAAMYKNEHVFTYDIVMVHMLRTLASIHGHEYGRHSFDILENEMTSEQVNESQRLATEWRVGTPLPTLNSVNVMQPELANIKNNLRSVICESSPIVEIPEGMCAVSEETGEEGGFHFYTYDEVYAALDMAVLDTESFYHCRMGGCRLMKGSWGEFMGLDPNYPLWKSMNGEVENDNVLPADGQASFSLEEHKYQVINVICEEPTSKTCEVTVGDYQDINNPVTKGLFRARNILTTLEIAQPEWSEFELDCYDGQCKNFRGQFVGLDPDYPLWQE